MRMPHRPGEPVYLDGQAGNPITRDRANKVLVHPFSGEMIAVQRSSELSVVPFLTDAVDPLHFGYFGGLATKVLWCVLGLVLSFSILAGAYLWVVRTTPGRTTPYLRGAAAAFALTVAYFLLVVFVTIRGIRDYGRQAPPAYVVAERAVGPYDVRVDCDAPCLPAEGAAFTARFRGAGLPLYRSAVLGLDGDGAAVPLSGPARAPSAVLHARPGAPLRLEVELRDGTTYAAVFRAPAGTREEQPHRPRLPDTAPGVWWVIGVFAALTVGFVAVWFYFVVRAVRAARVGESRPRARRGPGPLSARAT